MPLPKPVTEDEMLDRLVREVRRRYPDSRLQTPDYRVQSFYTDQWTCSQGVYWWVKGFRSGYGKAHAPEPILAVFFRGSKFDPAAFYVDETGISHADLQTYIDSIKRN